MLLLVINLLLLTLALYFIQEGVAQQQAAGKPITFFVDFPTELLPLAVIAVLLLIPNLAVIALSLLRNLYRRRWPWITTFIATVLLAIITLKVGFDGVLTIIDPS